MSKESNESNLDVYDLLLVLFVGLKLTGYLDGVSWIVIISVLWIPIAASIVWIIGSEIYAFFVNKDNDVKP